MGLFGILLLLVVLVVTVFGISIAWRGFRGAPALSDPTCAKCGYDLRGLDTKTVSACPECGADLAARHAVRWGRLERQPKKIVLGVIIAIAPFVLLVGLSFWAIHVNTRGGPAGVGRQTNAELTAAFSADIDDTWVSQELTRRATTGQLTAADVTALVDALIKGLEARPAGTDAPLYWSGDLVAILLADASVTDAQKRTVVEAYYRRPVKVEMRRKARRGAELSFEIDAGTAWQLEDSGQIYALRNLTLDGETVLRPVRRDGSRSELDGQAPFNIFGAISEDDMTAMEPGAHTLTFEVEVGIVEKSDTRVSPTGQRRVSAQWPEALHRWTDTVTVNLEVLGADESPIELFRDDTLTERLRRAIRVHSIIAETTQRGRTKLTPELTHDGQLPAPVAFTVSARCDGREYDLGSFAVGETGTTMSSLGRRFRETLPESVREATVILRAAPREVESMASFTRVWDGTLEYVGVPVDRQDLPDP
ncbi:MAG: hypothetical protein ACYTGP_04640 [Planctomycetota bacterium]|jgi:hypothetical protein